MSSLKWYYGFPSFQRFLDTTRMQTLSCQDFDKAQVYLQRDNDPKHKSKLNQQWLDNKSVDTLTLGQLKAWTDVQGEMLDVSRSVNSACTVPMTGT
ncbi:hypothetical protein RMATCC62417_00373 [Rhizopus microsporus]|nr:hypothetical protein RMATCC62417_00373 [Rhizopus microsporus]